MLSGVLYDVGPRLPLLMIAAAILQPSVPLLVLLVGAAVVAGLIFAVAAVGAPPDDTAGANRLQRAVGRGGEADVSWLPARPGWSWLLVSDGVYKSVRLDELSRIMEAPTAAEIAPRAGSGARTIDDLLFDVAFWPFIDGARGCAGLSPRVVRWSPQTPSGVRCGVLDHNVNVLGRGPSGHAGVPFDNVGVQYGLSGLLAFLNLPDVMRVRHLFAISAILGAAANAWLAWL